MHRVRCEGLRRTCSRLGWNDREISRDRADVCTLQMCRFHCGYFPDGDEKFVFARNGNPDYTIDLDMYEAEAHLVCMASSQSTVMLEHDYDRSLFPAVELRKAWDIFHHRRFLGKCRDCKAQLPDDPVLQTGDGCKCEMWSHFVGLRWLCIPCLLVEETKAYEGVGWRNVVGPLAVQVSPV
jgi:hypothetical protein